MPTDTKRLLYILSMVNVGIWAIAMFAMVILKQDSPGVKGLYPILGGGAPDAAW